MMPGITPLGKRWENLHSFWLLWLLVIYQDGNLSFIPFFYIGIRARKWKWILAGFGYLSVVLAFYLVKVFGYIEHPVFDITLALMLLFYVTAWVHGFWARKEYLQIIAKRTIAKQQKNGMQGNSSVSQKQVQQAVYAENKQDKDRLKKANLQGVIYINKASESEIAALTGEDLAKEISQVRRKHGRFHSIIDLIRHIHIKPHLLAEIKNHIVFEERIDEEVKYSNKHSKEPRGRMVDF